MIRWCRLLGLAAGCALGLSAQELKLQVLCTADTRGALLPEDPYTRQPRPGGWARLATLLRSQQSAPGRTLLVDCGNTLQGDPVSAIRARTRLDLPDPAIAIMNALGFHGMALGPRDFAYGIPILRGTEEQAQFPFLAANLLHRATGKPAFTPYALHEIQGVRVAILGLVGADPGDPALTWQDPLPAARTYLPQLREREKADLVVVALQPGTGGLTLARQFTEQVKSLDLLLLGATPEPAPASLAGVPILQASALGRGVGRAELDLVRERGRWHLRQTRTELLIADSSVRLDEPTLELTRPQRELADTYLDTFATALQGDLDGRWTRIEDTPLAQLLHAATREATQADLTAVSVPNPRLFIPAGATSIRQFWALAPSEDPVAVLRIQGAQLRAYLEHTARTYVASYAADLFQKSIPTDEVDLVAGCTYVLNLGAPLGYRVEHLKVNGKPVEATQALTLALPARRLRGEGGYLQAMGWKGLPLRTTPQSFRNLLLAYVLARPTLSIPLANHWRTVPYLDRERVASQQ